MMLNQDIHLKEQPILHLIHILDLESECLGKILEGEKSKNPDFLDFRGVCISNIRPNLMDLMTLFYTKPATS